MKQATPFPANFFQPMEANRFIESLRRDEAGFMRLAARLKQLSGIHLPNNEKNRILMSARLGEVMRRKGTFNYEAYLAILAANDRQDTNEFIEALTTNTTEFFRESIHFDILQSLLPEMIKHKMRTGKMEIRILCVPCSTGQEPYSIAMALSEAIPSMLGWNVRFLAADIDEEVLRRAARGVYSEAEAKGIPGLYRQKYFSSVKGQRGRDVVVHDSLRRMITFAPFNLMSEPYPFRHKFDIVFCRNVLIYFERETAAKVVRKLCQILQPGGYLFLGHSEVGIVNHESMTAVASAVYRRN